MTLPPGWAETTLGEIGVWRGGGTPSKANPSYWNGGGIPWVSPKDMKTEHISGAEDYITEAAVNDSATTLIGAGSVLVVVRSGILRRLLPVAVTTREVALNQDLKALIPYEGVSADFIARLLKSRGSQILHSTAKAGTTVDSLDFDQLKRTAVPLPPITEQHRIVAKLDAMAARLTRARAELDRTLSLAGRLRSAALTAAFLDRSGPDIPDPLTETIGIDARALPLPRIRAEWSWSSIGSVAAVTGGLTKNARRNGDSMEVEYLRVANVYANELRLQDVQRIGCTPADAKRTRLQHGDVLVVEGNGSLQQVGRAAMWRDELADCIHQNHLIRVRPSERIRSLFILFWLMSRVARRSIERMAASSSGLHTLSISKVSGIPIPVPGLEEQDRIGQAITNNFARADRLEAEAKKALALIDRLEAAILAKAFRGQLVPQDPNDEPASVLLDRIRARRAAAPKPARGRRPKPAS